MITKSEYEKILEVLENVAKDISINAAQLDWNIWEWQRGKK